MSIGAKCAGAIPPVAATATATITAAVNTAWTTEPNRPMAAPCVDVAFANASCWARIASSTIASAAEPSPAARITCWPRVNSISLPETAATASACASSDSPPTRPMAR